MAGGPSLSSTSFLLTGMSLMFSPIGSRNPVVDVEALMSISDTVSCCKSKFWSSCEKFCVDNNLNLLILSSFVLGNDYRTIFFITNDDDKFTLSIQNINEYIKNTIKDINFIKIDQNLQNENKFIIAKHAVSVSRKAITPIMKDYINKL